MAHRIVKFTDDSDRYYDFYNRNLYRNDGTQIVSNIFGNYERQLLELLVDHRGKTLTRGEILDIIKGKTAESPELKSVDNHILNLRKIIDRPLKAKVIESVRGEGYRYVGTPPTDGERILNSDIPSSLPHVLTDSVVPYADYHNILHRVREVKSLESILSSGKAAILLSGFGGIGKTAVAQVLYSKLAPLYDSIGWCVYHGNLKKSILSSFAIECDSTDAEIRWTLISSRIKNDRTKKLLIIDNVDYNAGEQQDPINDIILRDIAGWPDLSIVLTSRIGALPGYIAFEISALGSPNDPDPCIDLFYYYYDISEYRKSPSDRQEALAVAEIVRRAGYHTYAIELLAKSAIYEDSLYDFLEKIRHIGFQFPSLLVTTNHSNATASAAAQLQLLFNLRTRTDVEQRILWDFSVLPEGLSILLSEVKNLLSYSLNDLDCLCRDSWLRHKKGQGFYIHPLVREVIHLNLKNGKAPQGTIQHIFYLVNADSYISEKDSSPDIFKKLNILESALKYINFSSDLYEAEFYFKLGMLEYNYARRRLSSIFYLQQSLNKFAAISSTDSYHIAEIKYHLGYIESTTQEYREVSSKTLLESLELWNQLDGCEREIAMAQDHLGYVLSDKEETYDIAKKYLEKALFTRKQFLQAENTLENRRAYATTCDNLGFLLSKIGNDFTEASSLLERALEIRERIYNETGKYATDLAWTQFNLGTLLGEKDALFEIAEKHLESALLIRKQLGVSKPTIYSSSIVFSLVALAKHISKRENRLDDVEHILTEISQYKIEDDKEHTGFYSDEVANDIKYLERWVAIKKH